MLRMKNMHFRSLPDPWSPLGKAKPSFAQGKANPNYIY